MASHPKRPRDANQLAKFVMDVATGNRLDAPKAPPTAPEEQGRPGGLIGGRARAEALSTKARATIAKRAAAIRWGLKKGG